MKVDIVMPQMDESMAEGTVAKWLKKPGDQVQRDETVLEITTDKIDSEIPASRSGVLAEVLVHEGETVEVGKVLARIETDQQERKAQEPPKTKEPPKTQEPPKTKEQPTQQVGAQPKHEESKRDFLSPLVRNIARKEGLSLEEVKSIPGSGLGGRITKHDILGYLEERKAPPPEVPRREAPLAPEALVEGNVEIIPMSSMRKRIAEHMVLSKRTSPHTYTVAEVDMSRIANFREDTKQEFERREGFKLTYTAFILHAAVQALKQWPLLNSSVEGDKIIRKKYINVGVAVALEEGLIVPAIKNADAKSLLGLARAAYDLSSRARNKKLRPEEVQDGTFTITNPGTFGNLFGLPIINQPQVGILGVGVVKKRPVVIDDAIAIRSMMYLSLSYDHRVIDGAVAGQFLQTIVRNLEGYDVDGAL